MVGEQRACAVVYASAFAANIALCVVLIPLFGIAAARSHLGRDDSGIRAAVRRHEATPRPACVHLAAEEAAMTPAKRRSDWTGARARRRVPAASPAAPNGSRWPHWMSCAANGASFLAGARAERFYDPAFALAARDVFGAGIGAVLVWSRALPARLIGLFPLRSSGATA